MSPRTRIALAAEEVTMTATDPRRGQGRCHLHLIDKRLRWRVLQLLPIQWGIPKRRTAGRGRGAATGHRGQPSRRRPDLGQELTPFDVPACSSQEGKATTLRTPSRARLGGGATAHTQGPPAESLTSRSGH
eukprot:4395485-Amphidinium_carterae.1